MIKKILSIMCVLSFAHHLTSMENDNKPVASQFILDNVKVPTEHALNIIKTIYDIYDLTDSVNDVDFYVSNNAVSEDELAHDATDIGNAEFVSGNGERNPAIILSQGLNKSLESSIIKTKDDDTCQMNTADTVIFMLLKMIGKKINEYKLRDQSRLDMYANRFAVKKMPTELLESFKEGIIQTNDYAKDFYNCINREIEQRKQKELDDTIQEKRNE